MSTSQEAQYRTRMFARVIGPFLAVISATAVVHAPDLRTQVTDSLAAVSLWPWVAGSFTLLAGLIVVALHPYWHGVAAAGVSALGWLTTIKGVLLVAFPDTMVSVADTTSGGTVWLRVVYVAFTVLGLYLAYVGWAPARNRSLPQAAAAAADLPRAA